MVHLHHHHHGSMRFQNGLRSLWPNLIMTLFFAALFPNFFPGFCNAHIQLTYPPARFPALDFLDNSRTPPPCGVPKPDFGQGIITLLQAGSTFNVTWAQSYVHEGGFQVDLLNEHDELLRLLTPKHMPFIGGNDTSIQRYEVQLPSDIEECENCAIRLLRQAKEWGEYEFWSCADVTITANYIEHCSGNGRLLDGQHCSCDRLFSGPNCQYRDECWDNTDCGHHGMCKDLNTQSYPRKVCYCEMGFFGPKCNKPSVLQKKEFNPSLYQLRTVGRNNKIYWRIVEDTNEIEFVLQYATKSWMGIGWRPNGLSNQCQDISLLFKESSTLQQLEIDSISGSVGGAPLRNATFDSLPGLETTPTFAPANSNQPINGGSRGGATIGIDDGLEPQIITDPRNLSPELAAALFRNQSFSTAPQTAPSLIDLFPGQTNVTGKIIVPNLVTKKLPVLPSGGTVTGNVRPEAIEEEEEAAATEYHYETGEEPEQFNAEVGGTGPLSFTTGNTSEFSSASFKLDQQQPITAKTIPVQTLFNQSQSTSFIQAPPTASKANQVSLVEGENCYGQWKWPPDCIDSNVPPLGRQSCDYRVSWSLRDDSDEIEFSLEARSPLNSWTGIGFSATGSMADADMVVIESTGNGEILVKDMYSTGYTFPSEDPIQNVVSQGGTHVNGKIRVGFTRLRRNNDAEHDAQFTDTDCFYMLFPVGGGKIKDDQIQRHLETPRNSTVPVCIRQCGVERPVETQSCQTEFRFPPGCSPPSCDYAASWAYDEKTDDVTFEVTAREVGRWTGIGFSRDGNMTNSDMVVGWMNNGQAYVTDRFAYGKHQPAIDAVQNLDGISGSQVDDFQTLSFRRKLVTNDKREDLPLTDCLFFLFPIGGGRILARTEAEFSDKITPIGYHDLYIPRASKDPICICTVTGEPITPALLHRNRRQALSEPLPASAADLGVAGVQHRIPQLEHASDLHALAVNVNPELDTPKQSLATLAVPTSAEVGSDGASEPHLHPADQHPHPEPEPTAGTGRNGSSAAKTALDGTAAQPEPEPEPEAGGSEVSDAEEDTLENGMDCADMVIGSVSASVSRISDYYSFSRATPTTDSYYGGQDSLTAASGYEENGITTIMFRKPLKADGPTDQAIVNKEMTVIWAHGQENSLLYETDVLKYHGPNNRGVIEINFFDKASSNVSKSCAGQFLQPAGCTPSTCAYNATWRRNGNDADFSIVARVKTGSWTGIGFSAKGTMNAADMIIAKIDQAGIIEVTDRYSKGYAAPEIDREQGIFNIDASYTAGFLSVAFSRSLIPADGHEDVSLDACQFFLFPVNGGPLNADGSMSKHRGIPPAVSASPVCLTKCPAAAGGGFELVKEKSPQTGSGAGSVPEPPPKTAAVESGTTAEAPSTFFVHFYLPNSIWSDDLRDEGSIAYKELSAKLTDELTSKLQLKLSGFKSTRVLYFTNGSVHTHMELIAEGHTTEEIMAALANEVHSSNNRIADLKVDPDSIQVQKAEATVNANAELMRNYIIIGVACVLVLITLIIGICFCVKNRLAKTDMAVNGGSYAPYGTPYHYPTMGQVPDAKPVIGHQHSSSDGYVYSNEVYNNARLGTQLASSVGGPGGKGGAKSSSPESETKKRLKLNNSSSSPSSEEGDHNGRGPTTLNEWYQRVGNENSPQTNHNGSQQSGRRESLNMDTRPMLPPGAHPVGPRRVLAPGAVAGPYVQYPNDPYSYYTMNGHNRIMAMRGGVMPPPAGYYRPY